MNILIVAATEGEITPFKNTRSSGSYRDGGGWGEVLITGVGMVATAYSLTRRLQTHHYDFVLQAGVAGSFDSNIPLGEVVFITSDQYADLGAEDHEQYLDIFEMGLAEKDAFPFSGGKLLTPQSPVHERILLPRVSGLTVNMVSGSERTIRHREKYGCAIESMEGAAFHEVCLREGVPFAQVRAISNYVIPRDKSQWKMKDAIVNLNKWLLEFITIASLAESKK